VGGPSDEHLRAHDDQQDEDQMKSPQRHGMPPLRAYLPVRVGHRWKKELSGGFARVWDCVPGNAARSNSRFTGTAPATWRPTSGEGGLGRGVGSGWP
jgi:hypothetical protein